MCLAGHVPHVPCQAYGMALARHATKIYVLRHVGMARATRAIGIIKKNFTRKICLNLHFFFKICTFFFKFFFIKILPIFKRFAQVYFLRHGTCRHVPRHGFLWHGTGTAAHFFLMKGTLAWHVPCLGPLWHVEK